MGTGRIYFEDSGTSQCSRLEVGGSSLWWPSRVWHPRAPLGKRQGADLLHPQQGWTQRRLQREALGGRAGAAWVLPAGASVSGDHDP